MISTKFLSNRTTSFLINNVLSNFNCGSSGSGSGYYIQQQLNFRTSTKKKQLIKQKEREKIRKIEEKKKDNILIRENVNLKLIPNTDLVYEKESPKLNVLIGDKATNLLRESTRLQWHNRLKKTTSNLPYQQQQQQTISKNKEFKNTETDEKLLESFKNKKIGQFKQLKPKRGSTKLDIIRNEVKKDIERFFESKLKLIASAKTEKSFLPPTLPEVAFIGRSNVGKSSLINALTQRGLAKASLKPGTTQSINWYELGSTLYLVDLPGYGFAFAKNETIESWGDLTQSYLLNRGSSLKCVFVLLDARHGFKDSDRTLLKNLDRSKVKTHIILTKADLVPQEELVKRHHLVSEEVKTNYYHSVLPIVTLSSKSYAGISDLSKIIKTMKLLKKPVVTPPPPQLNNNNDDPKKKTIKTIVEKAKKKEKLKVLIPKMKK
eukprot:gene5685-7075_t